MYATGKTLHNMTSNNKIYGQKKSCYPVQIIHGHPVYPEVAVLFLCSCCTVTLECALCMGMAWLLCCTALLFCANSSREIEYCLVDH